MFRRFVFILAFGCVAVVWSQVADPTTGGPVREPVPVSWQAVPTFNYSLSLPVFTWGMGGAVSTAFGRNLLGVAAPGVYVRADLLWNSDAIFGPSESRHGFPGGRMGILEGSAGFALSRSLGLGRYLNLIPRVRSGVYFEQPYAAFTFDDSARAPDVGPGLGLALGADLELGIALWQKTDLAVGVSYDRHFGYDDFVAVSLGLRRYNDVGSRYYHGVERRGMFESEAGAPPGPHIQLLDADVGTVFPILKNYYEDQSFGQIELGNTSPYDLNDLVVSVSIPGLTDTATTLATIPHLSPGEATTVDLTAVFSQGILELTEAGTANAEIRIDYGILDYQEQAVPVVPIDYVDRNAVQWDDDAKIVSFMSVRDEAFKRISNRAIGLTRPTVRTGVDKNLQQAMILFELLSASGLAYVIDPASAYESLSRDSNTIDYVQFPRQTLYYRGGDCDDLSVTYNTLLESLGIETAFITTPGHIFTAFKLSMDLETAIQTFPDPNRIIDDEEGGAWLPVETTVLDRGFLVAWATGAQQWNRFSDTGEAAFFTTREAWRTYQPVQAVGGEPVEEVDGARLVDRFEQELDRFVRAQVEPAEQQLKARLEQRPNDARTRNRLAVLYGRYGLFEQALEHLDPLVADGYDRARVNLANSYFLVGRIDDALSDYLVVLADDPENAAALVGAAQCYFALGQYAESNRMYERLLAVNDAIAARYSFLGSGNTSARASAATADPTVEWVEEVE